MYANRFDRAVEGVYEARESDWRQGAVVYQVLVDRFAPSADLEAKRHLYPAPKRLRSWDEVPAPGRYLPEEKLWSQEIEFWGGDLASTRAHLGHVQQLGADVLYLNPICHAHTNHKYDALDYHAVSPEYGTRDDVRALADDLHGRGMRLMLDGVFNHMGRHAPVFTEAAAQPGSPVRDWFFFGDEFPGGARGWMQAQNLPELRMEHPAVQEHLYAGRDSVVRRWLRDGVDGWRLDVAHDIGFTLLEQITRAAHEERPGSWVVGEIAGYPREWFPSVDGVMHFALRGLLLRLADGRIDADAFGRMVARMVADCGTENLLRSWIFLENHDTERLATRVPEVRMRRLLQALQFTLPGSPNLFYGGELDMEGGADPAMRAPMRWDLATPEHPALAWTRQLAALRRAHRALRVGDYRPVEAQRLFAFERHTDRAADTVIVVANPSDDTLTETLMVANSKMMESTPLTDLLLPAPGAPLTLSAALLDVTMPPRSLRVLAPRTAPQGGYTPYKRVQ